MRLKSGTIGVDFVQEHLTRTVRICCHIELKAVGFLRQTGARVGPRMAYSVFSLLALNIVTWFCQNGSTQRSKEVQFRPFKIIAFFNVYVICAGMSSGIFNAQGRVG